MGSEASHPRIAEVMRRHLAALACGAMVTTGVPLPAYAALTDLSSSPLAANAAVQTKPNIMLLMDTSGSMAWGHMPDEVEQDTKTGYNNGQNSIGYKSTQCNAIYYNPAIIYKVPKLADGTFFPTPSFGGAPYNGYASFLTGADATDLSTVDLGSAFRAYDAKTLRATTAVPADTPQPAYYYVYSGPQTPVHSTPVCRQLDVGGSVTAVNGGTWTKVVVSSTSGPAASDERQNFAIWYTFYRTRMGLIKSAASMAFNPLNDSYRVGFITVEPKTNPTDSAINPAKYVQIADFNTAQRGLWYTKLFSQPAEGASPAREGLARVGRHYAGRQDGINNGMTGDPVQYSCQQNFTIMTTDGYWNSQSETPGAGPVQIDGVTRVGQQDGNYTPYPGYTTRPIWEGTANDTTVVTDNNNNFVYTPCGTYLTLSTEQLSEVTYQLIKATSQLVYRTVQTTESTSQISRSTTRQTRSTLRHDRTETIRYASTSQWTRNTTQRLEWTSQTFQDTVQRQQRQERVEQSTTQMTQSTQQMLRSTTQTQQRTVQRRIQTSRTDMSTSQVTQSTSRITQSTEQQNSQTSQMNRSTSQVTTRTEQRSRTTSQDRSCNALTENCSPVPVGSCVAAGFFYCQTVVTGPDLVASCTPESPSVGNNYTTVNCSTATTGPSPVASCTPQAPTSGNSFVERFCDSVNTGPTPVASCTSQTANSGNAWTNTSCNPVIGPITPVASCTPVLAAVGNDWTATNCIPVTTGPFAVGSCTPVAADAGNNWTAITCGTANSGPTGVSSCSPQAADSGNGWTNISCSTVLTGPTPVSTCTPASASAGNSWVDTSCTPVTTGPTPVASCSTSGATAMNSWTTTTCPNIESPWAGVASCSPVVPDSGNSYTETQCQPNNSGPTGVQTCMPAAGDSGNSWVTTTCTPNNTGPTPVASCTPQTAGGGNAWLERTCAPVNTGPTAVASCTNTSANAGNSYTATACNTIVVQPWTDVASCTPELPNAGNGYVATICRDQVVAHTPSGSCSPSGPNGGGQSVVCNTVLTGPTPVASCTPQTGDAGNNWLTRTCGDNNTGPTLVASCTDSTANSGNAWTNTSCSNVATGPTAVASCTNAPAGPGNNYVATTCTSSVTTTAQPSCSYSAPTLGNGYMETTCNDVTSGPTPVASCSVIPADGGNNWTATLCNTIVTGPTLTASCSEPPPNSGNDYTTTTCTDVTTGPTPVSTCTAQTPDAGNSYVRITCNTATSADTGTASCTPVTATAGNSWTETQCVTLTTSDGAETCTAEPAGTGNSWTDTSCTPTNTGPTLVAACTPQTANAGNHWKSVSCSSVTTGPVVVGSCTPELPTSANNYVRTTCGTTQGSKIQYTTTTTVTTSMFDNGFPIGPPVTTTSTSPLTDLDGTCYPPGMQPALPNPNPQPAGIAAGPYPPAPCTAWPCTQSTSNSIGSIDSLADVAQYYYVTDLRPSMLDNVRPHGTGAEDDRAPWQHMTTFTIGLGVSGTLKYRSDYKSSAATTGDFADIRTGAKSWPVWPDPAVNYDPFSGGSYENWNNPKAIDDFWHTAVNGRGTYFSADKPDTVVTGIAEALSGIEERVGAGSGVTLSNNQPVAGDNFAFTSTYTTSKWIGEVNGYSIDVATGVIGASPNWSAQSQLDAMTRAACDSRNIYLFRDGAANNMVNFSWNSYRCNALGVPTGSPDTGLNATERAYFSVGNAVSNLSHYLAMTDGSGATVDQRTAAADANLVNYLRGQRGLEGFVTNDLTRLYRARANVLGDVVNGQPAYVRAPFATYQDSGYDAYKTAQSSRAPMLYVPANDGMLHAIHAGNDALGGTEAWAFMPSAVLPEVYKLADNNYKNNHRFFVDGTPVAGDAYDGSQWKTLLVGGLGNGGKSYYALDVTDPVNPKALWEFKWSNTCYSGAPGTKADCHLGYTYGKPVISKLANGTWVVMFGSGYNNVNTPNKAGDGHGYLYVLNAFSGDILYKIDTGAGDAATPAGLAHINSYVDYAAFNNTTRQVYAGDLLGNIWRFDVNDTFAPSGREAALIGVATDSGGTPQPITTRPELAELQAKPIVLVGTGRLLGTTDFTNTQVQSVYGITDPMTAGPVYSNLRSTLRPLAMTQSGSTRTIACTGTPAQCASGDGWMFDLPDSGERVNVEMRLVRGTLVFASNVPDTTDPCKTGGYSWLNYVSFASGLAISTSPGLAVSVSTMDSLATGLSMFSIGATQYGYGRGTDGRVGANGNGGGGGGGSPDNIPYDTPPPTGKRISWREIGQ